jgi:hypothetical protein
VVLTVAVEVGIVAVVVDPAEEGEEEVGEDTKCLHQLEKKSQR